MMQKLKRTELTELSSGFKNKKPKKMELSRVTSGYHPQSMSAIGEITAKRGSVSSTTRMATNTKECGQLTNDTVRAHTGEMKIRNSDVNIPATGLKIKSTAVEHFSIKMAIVTTDIGLMDNPKEKVE